MKKLKQITALIGVILLIGLYVSTLILAIIGGERALELLRAAIGCTIVLPVLLWTYSLIFRTTKNNADKKREYYEKHSSEDTDEKTDS